MLNNHYRKRKEGKSVTIVLFSMILYALYVCIVDDKIANDGDEMGKKFEVERISVVNVKWNEVIKLFCCLFRSLNGHKKCFCFVHNTILNRSSIIVAHVLLLQSCVAFM